MQASLPTESGKGAAGKSAPPAHEDLSAAFPQFEILELIGQGGMGFVFKARQPKLDRFVALKILSQTLAADPAFAERFMREGRMLARLNHPNIVTIHDFGEANGFFYLLMEYVDGVNLRQAMKADRFTPSQALAIVPKICEALQFAHSEGILHRDIKPENILLDSKGRVKIADFGIAKLVGEQRADASLTGTGLTLGTPHYMAPEQIENSGEVDHRADIYSLGVVFYEMLTGGLPIGRFAPPSEKSAADPRVDEVVLRTLEKERERRTQTAGELKTQVETIASSPRQFPAKTESIRGGPKPRGVPPLKSSLCYLSTPEHLRTLFGRMVYLYTGSGELRLGPEHLTFVEGARSVTIPLQSIKDLSIGHYPRTAKPARLNYISVTFEENGTTRRLLFTPYESGFQPTWVTNRFVNDWFTAVREAATAATGCAPNFTPPEELAGGNGRGGGRVAVFCILLVALAFFAAKTVWVREKAPPGAASEKELMTRFESALKSRDTNAFLALYNWQGVSKGMKKSQLYWLDGLMKHQTNDTHIIVRLAPLTADFNETEMVRDGVRYTPNVSLLGMISGSVRWIENGTNCSWGAELPYGKNNNGFYLAGVAGTKIYDAKTKDKMLAITVATSNFQTSVIFNCALAYVQNGEVIKKEFIGPYLPHKVFFGDYIKSCVVRKTSDDKGSLQLAIWENGKKLFESRHVETKDPIVYERNGTNSPSNLQ